MRVPWTARRSNQSILEEIRPEYSLEGLILKLELQYFGHLTQKTDTLEKTPMLGKTKGRRRRGRQRMRWLDVSPTRWNEFEQVPGVGRRRQNGRYRSSEQHTGDVRLLSMVLALILPSLT